MALETLTCRLAPGVAAAAAALGQLHYYDALDAQPAFDVLSAARNEAGPRQPPDPGLPATPAPGSQPRQASSASPRQPPASPSDAERTGSSRPPHAPATPGPAFGRQGRWPCLAVLGSRPRRSRRYSLGGGIPGRALPALRGARPAPRQPPPRPATRQPRPRAP